MRTLSTRGLGCQRTGRLSGERDSIPRRLGTLTEKRTARPERPQPRERAQRHEDLPTWRRTRPPGNPEVHRADLERSTERLEMLLGH
jgi:hypothetical protein